MKDAQCSLFFFLIMFRSLAASDLYSLWCLPALLVTFLCCLTSASHHGFGLNFFSLRVSLAMVLRLIIGSEYVASLSSSSMKFDQASQSVTRSFLFLIWDCIVPLMMAWSEVVHSFPCVIQFPVEKMTSGLDSTQLARGCIHRLQVFPLTGFSPRALSCMWSRREKGGETGGRLRER